MQYAIAAMVASTVLTSLSSYESGRAEKRAADFNAAMAEKNAENARAAARARSEIQERDTRRRLSTMRQQYAKAGVEVDEGTPLTVLMESAAEAAKDRERIKAGGEMTAWGFLSEAEMQRARGRTAERAGFMGAGTSLLGGAARGYMLNYRE